MWEFTSDIEAILARRHDNGADFWATPKGKIYVGNPFSAITSLSMLHELDVPPEHEAVSGGLELILAASRDDGRIRVGPKSPMYPCYTAEAARTLCRFGLIEHEGVRRTAEYLLGATHESGGWRCSFSRFGKGPEHPVRESRNYAQHARRPPVRRELPSRQNQGRRCGRVPSQPLGTAQADRALSPGHRKPVHAGRVSLRAIQPVPLRLRAFLLRMGQTGSPPSRRVA